MFESISNMFGNVKSFFVGAYHNIADTVKGIVTPVYDTAKSVVTTLHDDVVGYAKGVKDVATTAINETSGVIKHGETAISGAVENIGKSLTMPLIIGAVAIAGVMFLKK